MTFKNHDSFCPALWTSIYTHPDGRVDSCCVGKNDFGNMRHNRVIEIMHGDKARTIRKDMLDGASIPGCAVCDRQDRDATLQKFFVDQYSHIPDAWYQDTNNFSLRYVDMRWNNTCNLACIYCGSECSSLWDDINRRKNNIPIQKTQRQERNDLLEYVLDNVDTIERVYLAGGEPLMIKENVTFLEKLYEANPNCNILVNSNITLLGDNPVYALLKKFRQVSWLISAESQGSLFEHIRWPAKWDVFRNNFEEIVGLRRDLGHLIYMNMVLMNINALAIWDFIDFLGNEFDVQHPYININLCDLRDSNSRWALTRLPPEFRTKVKQRIGSGYRDVRNFDNVYASIDDPYPENYSKTTYGLEDTVRHLDALSRERSIDFRAVLPVFYEFVDMHR